MLSFLSCLNRYQYLNKWRVTLKKRWVSVLIKLWWIIHPLMLWLCLSLIKLILNYLFLWFNRGCPIIYSGLCDLWHKLRLFHFSIFLSRLRRLFLNYIWVEWQGIDNIIRCWLLWCVHWHYLFFEICIHIEGIFESRTLFTSLFTFFLRTMHSLFDLLYNLKITYNT